MAPRPVEAVFFFKWTASTQRAIYNRLSGDRNLFTKNYFQVSGPTREAFDQAFGRTGDDEVLFQWRWPADEGGNAGRLKLHSKAEKTPRLDLAWIGGGKAPLTWKLGDPTADPRVTIPGDPTLTDESAAEAQLEAVTHADIRPWFVAVKLAGEPDQLHARAYLENPPDGLEHADIALLPSVLLAAIQDISGEYGAHVPTTAPPPKPRAPKIVEAIQKALADEPNVLLVGPPGTGKTVALDDMQQLVRHVSAPLLFDPDKVHDAFESGSSSSKVASLVFHSSYGYENFVAGLVPSSDEDGMSLEVRPGPLVNLAKWAIASERRALLVLDEFNRGPTAAIFGDTLALLDGSKRYGNGELGAHIVRPFPDRPMQVPVEYADVRGSRDVPAELRLPENLKIVAALNSSDRSVAPLDAALRRRFAIVRVDPDPEVLAEHYGVPLPTGAPQLPGDPANWSADHVKDLALRLLADLNERIAFVLGDDFLLGHALLWPIGDAEGVDEARSALCACFDARIVQSLRLTFADQDELLAAVLHAGGPESAPPAGPTVAAWRQPPAELEAVAQPHLHVRSVREMDWPDAARALLAVLG